MEISIVIPAYNEEGNIAPLYEKIAESLSKITSKYEIIYVDDGSTDMTANNVEALHKKDSKVHLIQFRKNFGKAAALSAGIENAKGEIIITLDADLQDDPSEISKLINKLNEGFDLVVGWKKDRKDPFITKKLPSKIFNLLIRILHKVNIHDSDCNFRVMRKELAKDLLFYGGLFRYIPSLANWKGYKVTEEPVEHQKRFSGKAKFKSLGRLVKGFLDLITTTFLIKYRNSPLYFFGSSGLALLFLGFIGGLSLLYNKYINGQLIGGRPLLLLTALLIILGVQFIFFGLLAEMITHNSQSQTKNYNIKKKI